MNDLTNKDFINFKSIVKLPSSKELHLHDLGNDIYTMAVRTLNENLPIIPKIYFEPIEKTEPLKTISITNSDLYGQNIINRYYKIKHSMKKLSISKTYILSIIKNLKYELEEYNNVSKKKFNILKKNLLINFKSSIKDTFKNQDDFIKFKKSFCKESFNIFKGFSEKIPLFSYIFHITYIGLSDSKNYFNRLFKKYMNERNILIKYINNNFGLLSFSPMFDIENVVQFQNESSKNTNDPINYNKYILFSKNEKNENNENEINSKKELNDKINEFNLLYISPYNSDYYTDIHQKNIERINNEIKESLDKLLNGKDLINLYEIILITLQLDFNLLELMYYYCEKTLYETAIKNHDQIKKYILNKLNTVDIYFDLYKEWLYKGQFNVEHSNSGIINKKIDNLIDYRFFFKNILSNFKKKSIKKKISSKKKEKCNLDKCGSNEDDEDNILDELIKYNPADIDDCMTYSILCRMFKVT
jgi:hypothetical protein